MGKVRNGQFLLSNKTNSPITITGDDVVVSRPFTSEDPRFVVVTVKHTPATTGTLELFDSSDGFVTEVSIKSVALETSGVTVLRVGTVDTEDAPMRGLLRVKMSVDVATPSVSSVVVDYAG